MAIVLCAFIIIQHYYLLLYLENQCILIVGKFYPLAVLGKKRILAVWQDGQKKWKHLSVLYNAVQFISSTTNHSLQFSEVFQQEAQS